MTEIRRGGRLAAMVMGGIALLGLPAWAQEGKRGGDLRVAIAAEPNTLDCHQTNTYATIHFLAPHYSLLLRFDPKNYPDPIPDLAESWEVSPDKLTYRFKLRPGVKFHDGDTLTSADVAASIARQWKPPPGILSPRLDEFASIAAIETPDPLTVVVRLAAVDPTILYTLASPWTCIYSARHLAEDQRWYEKNVVGTGPFRFAERVPGSHWVGRRFEDYYDKRLPYLDSFRNILVTGTATVNALMGGQVDTDWRGVTPAERDRLVAGLGDRIKVAEGPSLTVLLLSLNNLKPPFDDVRVRRALILALDRWAAAGPFARTTILSHAGGLLRPGYALAATREELEQWPGFGKDIQASRAEARRLLQEAGVPNLKFTLTSRNIPDPYTSLGVWLIDQWRQIGVTVEQVRPETNAYFNALVNGNYDVAIDFSNSMIDDPSLHWKKYLSKDRQNTNYAGYIDRELDSLYDAQRLEADPVKRRALLRRFEARMYQEAHLVPLFWYGRLVPMAAALKGYDLVPNFIANQDLVTVWFDR